MIEDQFAKINDPPLMFNIPFVTDTATDYFRTMEEFRENTCGKFIYKQLNLEDMVS